MVLKSIIFLSLFSNFTGYASHNDLYAHNMKKLVEINDQTKLLNALVYLSSLTTFSWGLLTVEESRLQDMHQKAGQPCNTTNFATVMFSCTGILTIILSTLSSHRELAKHNIIRSILKLPVKQDEKNFTQEEKDTGVSVIVNINKKWFEENIAPYCTPKEFGKIIKSYKSDNDFEKNTLKGLYKINKFD